MINDVELMETRFYCEFCAKLVYVWHSFIAIIIIVQCDPCEFFLIIFIN